MSQTAGPSQYSGEAGIGSRFTEHRVRSIAQNHLVLVRFRTRLLVRAKTAPHPTPPAGTFGPPAAIAEVDSESFRRKVLRGRPSIIATCRSE